MKKILILFSLFSVLCAFAQNNMMEGELFFEITNPEKNTLYEYNKSTHFKTSIPDLENLLFSHGLEEIKDLSGKTFLPNGNRFFWMKFGKTKEIENLKNSLSQFQEIRNVSLVPTITIDSNDPLMAYPEKRWHLDKIEAENAWAIMDASGNENETVVVVVVDNSIDIFHPDLEHNIWVNQGEIPDGLNIPDLNNNGIVDATEIIDVYGTLKIAFDTWTNQGLFDGVDGTDQNEKIDDVFGWDFADDNNMTGIPDFQYYSSQFFWSHGTYIAGLISADTDNNFGTASMGRNVKILPLKTAPDGSGGNNYSSNTYFEVLNYLQYMVGEFDVVNFSNGIDVYSLNFETLINEISEHAIIVGSAGNNNTQAQHYPAAFENVIGVAATNPSDIKYNQSNYGPWVSISAPGFQVWSLDCYNMYTLDYPFDKKSGTSASAAIVSSVAAVLKQYNSSMPNHFIETCLLEEADPTLYNNGASANTMGTGVVNARASLQCLQSIASSTPDVVVSSNFQTACPGEDIYFNWKNNLIIENAPETFLWDFGDGTTSTETYPIHAYATEGLYTITLTASNSNGSNFFMLSDYIRINSGSLSYLSPNSDNIWEMAHYNGMDFNALEVLSTSTSAIYYLTEGGSAIANEDGNKLFYSGYTNVFNRFDLPMVNSSGTEIIIHLSGTQNAIIIPKPVLPCDLPRFYYLFYLDVDNNLRVATIDINSNNGLGEIVENEILEAEVSERLTATLQCNGTDFWVMSHDEGTDFIRIPVTSSGVGVPQFQTISSTLIPANAIGEMKISPDRNYLGIVSGNGNLIHIYPFDYETGMIDASGLINMSNPNFQPYGFEFSPNSQLFYVSGFDPSGVECQLFQGDFYGVINSIATVPDLDGGSVVQLARDGNIYWGQADLNHLIQVRNPNSTIDPEVLIIENWYNNSLSFGKPQAILSRVAMGNNNQLGLEPIYYLCDENTSVDLTVGSQFDQVQWSTGAQTHSINISEEGEYWVRATEIATGCVYRGYTEVRRMAELNVEADFECGNSGKFYDFIATPGFEEYTWDVYFYDPDGNELTNTGLQNNLTSTFNKWLQFEFFDANTNLQVHSFKVILTATAGECSFTASLGIERYNGFYGFPICIEGNELTNLNTGAVLPNISVASLSSGKWLFNDNVFIRGDDTYVNIVNGDIDFVANCKLRIEDLAYLRLTDGTTISNSHCDDKPWKGIEVVGNASNPHYITTQPMLQVAYGSQIEGAEIGAQSIDGGVIQVKYGKFINNAIAVQFDEYGQTNTSGSLISFSLFETNDDIALIDDQEFNTFIIADEFSSLEVKHSTLQNLQTEVPFYLRGTGIKASGTDITFGYSISISDYDPLMKGLNEGLVIDNAEMVDIKYATFEDNYQGALLRVVGTTTIEQNTFNDENLASYNDAFQLKMDECLKPDVLLNSFNNAVAGLVIEDGGESDYDIYKNTFDGFDNYNSSLIGYPAAIVAMGENGNDNSGPSSKGMQLRCNSFSNYDYAIALMSGKIKRDQGQNITDNPKAPVNNVFLTDPLQSQGQFFISNAAESDVSGTNDLKYNYYYPNQTGNDAILDDFTSTFPTAPTADRMTANPVDLGTGTVFNYELVCLNDPDAGSENPCPPDCDQIPGGLSAPVSELPEVLFLIDMETFSLEQTLDAKIDNGSTNILLGDIQISNADNYDALVSEMETTNTYISDEVALEFMDKDVSRPVAKTVALIANSPLSEPAQQKIDDLEISDQLKNLLKTYQTGVSAKTIEEAEINKLKQIKQKVLKQSYLDIQNDTLLNDSLKQLQMHTYIDILADQLEWNNRKQALKMMLKRSRLTDAESLISDLRQEVLSMDEAEQGSKDLFLDLMQLKAEAKNMDATERYLSLMENKDWLLSLANGAFAEGKTEAAIMLEKAGLKSSEPKVMLPMPGQENRSAMAEPIQNQFDFSGVADIIEIYPNPVKDQLSVEFVMFNGRSVEALGVYDLNAKLVKSQKIGQSYGLLKINVQDLKSGTYIIAFGTEGVSKTSKKFVVNR